MWRLIHVVNLPAVQHIAMGMEVNKKSWYTDKYGMRGYGFKLNGVTVPWYIQKPMKLVLSNTYFHYVFQKA